MNVLFLCTGNSCRSLMGEAIFKHLAPDGWHAISAGSKPIGRLNSGAVALLEATPALLKEWFDLVWRRGFAYGEGGVALAGKSMLCAVSSGGRTSDYGPDGRFGHSVEEFLRPLERTAHLCGMRWETPFVVPGEAAATPAALRREAQRWRERLEAVRMKGSPRR